MKKYVIAVLNHDRYAYNTMLAKDINNLRRNMVSEGVISPYVEDVKIYDARTFMQSQSSYLGSLYGDKDEPKWYFNGKYRKVNPKTGRI